jgi:hypothetical protein
MNFHNGCTIYFISHKYFQIFYPIYKYIYIFIYQIIHPFSTYEKYVKIIKFDNVYRFVFVLSMHKCEASVGALGSMDQWLRYDYNNNERKTKSRPGVNRIQLEPYYDCTRARLIRRAIVTRRMLAGCAENFV